MANSALKPGLYAILDDDSLENLARRGQALLKLPLAAVQVRAKCLEPLKRQSLARHLAGHIPAASASPHLIINDDWELAETLGLPVHLGWEDMQKFPRALQSLNVPFGISTHSIEQALQAQALGAFYIGYGPVFATQSKADALAPRGTQDLPMLLKQLRIPLVAIGGIQAEHLGELTRLGVRQIAMLSGVKAPEEGVERLVHSLQISFAA